jgi:indolepyruvate ferredoxin oxidoreductase
VWAAPGVITIGQLLGVAAHLEGKGIVTQDAGGLAQKGGATWSHVLIGATQDDIRTTRVSMAAADLIIGCDPIVTAGKETVLRMREGRTHVALNAQGTPTAAFVKNANWQNPSDQCVADITRAVGEAGVGLFNADAVAGKLMGDTIYVNPMILGYAWQKGWIPLGRESLLRAIELNAVAVENNKTAFEWGRQAAHDRARVEALLSPGQVVEFRKRETLETPGHAARRIPHGLPGRGLCGVVQGRLSRRFRLAEMPLGKTVLAENVARYLFKLMAYKDEYEVARLHTQTGFQEKINGDVRGRLQDQLTIMAPPMTAKAQRQGRTAKAASSAPGHADRL